MQRLRTLGILVAFVTFGVVLVSLLQGFQALVGQPIALLATVALAGLMTAIFVLVALVPSRRYTGWARTITSINTRWLFFLLILGWIGAMGLLAAQGLGPQQMGAPALVGLFAGIFLFMGFIWAVIGE
ncbi:MAG TPA: hypothetical protein VH741_05985 [Candidatus Limnocylindrales bacterium]|jgi:hypothetical protein